MRGTRLAMIFQDPMTSLNPVRSIGQQMIDIQYRNQHRAAEKLAKAADALKRVGIPDAREQLQRYPAEFSGGMRQRICIAMSFLQKPELLIADEITTALDVTLEAQVLHLLRELRQELNGSILFISHNLGAVAEICDSVVVLYAGEVVEQGPVVDIFDRPQHPYTRALVECDPARIAEITRELPVIPGDVPNLRAIPQACIFAPRCSAGRWTSAGAQRPAPIAVGEGHHVARCHLLGGRPRELALRSQSQCALRHRRAGQGHAGRPFVTLHRCGARRLLRRRARHDAWRSSAKAARASRRWRAPSSA